MPSTALWLEVEQKLKADKDPEFMATEPLEQIT